MGLILDTCILIAGERRKETVKQVIQRIHSVLGETEAALSTVSIVELTHGIYRARTDADRERRKSFCDELCRDMVLHPVSLEIAQLAGRIEGEQAAQGISIAFEDLLIGVTALHLGFDVATLNVKHFQRMPGLKVVAL
ncbi:MAG TPA: PIN domain-containing protein [Terracidiphilus sp.]|jgi:predicted nucleic acid-binding protein|nr:PIN domain-containing protein [Terracidiphilus sp.]